MGTSAALGGVTGYFGRSGWQHGQTALGLTTTSLGRNGLKYGLSIAGVKNLSRVIFPAIFAGFLGGVYGRIGNRHNPTGYFVGF